MALPLSSDQRLDVLEPEAMPALRAEAHGREITVGDELPDATRVDAENVSNLFRSEQPSRCDGGHAFLGYSLSVCAAFGSIRCVGENYCEMSRLTEERYRLWNDWLREAAADHRPRRLTFQVAAEELGISRFALRRTILHEEERRRDGRRCELCLESLPTWASARRRFCGPNCRAKKWRSRQPD
jgi:hypothetical protein